MLEERYYKSACEVRQGDAGPMIVGYASVFNSDSEDLGGFIEQVDPAAFSRTVTQADVRGLANHDQNWLLGRTKAGTLRLAIDNRGLRYEIDVNTADPDGQRALAKVQRGDWDGSSFSFQCIRDEWDWQTKPARRRLLEVALVDVGPVTFPAYPDSSATSRALTKIASRAERTADELASMLLAGQGQEIRSLIEKEIAMPPEVDEQDEATDSEARAGKMISNANAEVLRSAIDAIQALLDASDESTGGGISPESNGLFLAPTLRLLARQLESREMPDQGGDPENLVAMTGAVAAAYLAKLQDLGLDTPENGFYLSPIADQDGDADGDGPTLFCVTDNAACWYILANGDSAEVIAWDGNEWSYAWRDADPQDEKRESLRLAEAMLSTRDRELSLMSSAA